MEELKALLTADTRASQLTLELDNFDDLRCAQSAAVRLAAVSRPHSIQPGCDHNTHSQQNNRRNHRCFARSENRYGYLLTRGQTQSIVPDDMPSHHSRGLAHNRKYTLFLRIASDPKCAM